MRRHIMSDTERSVTYTLTIETFLPARPVFHSRLKYKPDVGRAVCRKERVTLKKITK